MTAGAGHPDGHRREAGGFETLAIHAGQEPDPLTGAPDLPGLHLRPGRVGGLRAGYEYSQRNHRTAGGVPVAGGRTGAFASGMAAEDCLPHRVLARRPRLIPHDAYGGTYRLFDKVLSRWR
jgi:cystathionine gamma-synthase